MKFKIIFYSYGKVYKETVSENQVMKRLQGGIDNLVSIWNSQKTEVFMQDENDRRKWILWQRFTSELFPINV